VDVSGGRWVEVGGGGWRWVEVGGGGWWWVEVVMAMWLVVVDSGKVNI